MSIFADDIERLAKLHEVADDGVKPLIEKAIEALIEKERECRRADSPIPCIPPLNPGDSPAWWNTQPMKPENPPFWWNTQPTCGEFPMNLCKGGTRKTQEENSAPAISRNAARSRTGTSIQAADEDNSDGKN